MSRAVGPAEVELPAQTAWMSSLYCDGGGDCDFHGLGRVVGANGLIYVSHVSHLDGGSAIDRGDCVGGNVSVRRGCGDDGVLCLVKMETLIGERVRGKAL